MMTEKETIELLGLPDKVTNRFVSYSDCGGHSGNRMCDYSEREWDEDVDVEVTSVKWFEQDNQAHLEVEVKVGDEPICWDDWYDPDEGTIERFVQKFGETLKRMIGE